MLAHGPDNKTHKPPNGADDRDICHGVCTCQTDVVPRLALCGVDCTDALESKTFDSWCVVCVDLLTSGYGCVHCGAGRG